MILVVALITQVWLQQYDLKLNIKKTEYMEMSLHTNGSVVVHKLVQKLMSSRYLGELRSKQRRHTKWCQRARQQYVVEMLDFLRNPFWRKILRWLRSITYHTVNGPTAMYRSDCPSMIKKDETRANVMKTQLLQT